MGNILYLVWMPHWILLGWRSVPFLGGHLYLIWVTYGTLCGKLMIVEICTLYGWHTVPCKGVILCHSKMTLCIVCGCHTVPYVGKKISKRVDICTLYEWYAVLCMGGILYLVWVMLGTLPRWHFRHYCEQRTVPFMGGRHTAPCVGDILDHIIMTYILHLKWMAYCYG